MSTQLNKELPEHILIEMEKDKPSPEPSYWAKSSCKHCYGRGVIGTVTTRVKGNNTICQHQLCSCALKKYEKWQEQWLVNRRKKVFGHSA